MELNNLDYLLISEAYTSICGDKEMEFGKSPPRSLRMRTLRSFHLH